MGVPTSANRPAGLSVTSVRALHSTACWLKTVVGARVEATLLFPLQNISGYAGGGATDAACRLHDEVGQRLTIRKDNNGGIFLETN